MSIRSIVGGSCWVRYVTLTIGLLFFSRLSICQEVAVLEDYDFSAEDYTMIFYVPVEAETKYVLYTQDSETLNQLKQAWVFDTEAVTYPFGCNDGYSIALQRNFKTLETFEVRLRCKAFIARGEYWHLPVGLALGSMNLDTAMVVSRQYNSLVEAREDLALSMNNPNIIGVNPPEWEKHDGYFHFRYPNPGFSPKGPAIDWGGLTLEVKDQIQQKFPNEDFDLELTYYGYGKNYPTVGFKLSGKKSLFMAFDLYPNSDRGWMDFELLLTLYEAK